MNDAEFFPTRMTLMCSNCGTDTVHILKKLMGDEGVADESPEPATASQDNETMTVLGRIAEMEKRLLKQMPEGTPEQDGKAEEAIHRFAMLVAQSAAIVLIAEEFGDGTTAFADYITAKAKARFPLPPKRVLREEPDPNDGGVLWRWNGRLEFSPDRPPSRTRVWVVLGSDPCIRTFTPYPERIDLWHSLKHEPFREVPDNGDE